jgi:hypothetical protein
MLDWAIGPLAQLFGFAGGVASGIAGWAWDKVTTGIYTWLANGLAVLIEWVWGILNSATTPRVTDDWFRNELAAQISVLALAVTVAMMLASASQAALAGRPEQITDAIKEGARAVVATAFTITIIDLMVRVVDEASGIIWQSGRADLVKMIEGIVFVATQTGPLGSTFVGPLCLLIGFIGLIGLTISLLMRSALIYLAAAIAPLVWSSTVLPVMRGSGRRLIHLLVALIFSKLAIVVTLVVAVKLIGNVDAGPNSPQVTNDAAAAVGMLLTGFVCFLVAAISPFVLYRLMPTVEGAVTASGIAGGWGRSMLSTAQAGMMAKGLGESAATRRVAGQSSGASASAGQGAAVQGLAVATGGAAAVAAPAAMVQSAGNKVKQTASDAVDQGSSSSEAKGSAAAQKGQTPTSADGRAPGADRPSDVGRKPTPTSTGPDDDGSSA